MSDGGEAGGKGALQPSHPQQPALWQSPLAGAQGWVSCQAPVLLCHLLSLPLPAEG